MSDGTPRLVIDTKRQFVRRKTAALEVQREEFRTARRVSALQRQANDMQAKAQQAQEAAERAEAEAASLSEAEAAERKRQEADKNKQLAEQMWDTVDTLLGEIEELTAVGVGMLDKKAALLREFADAIEYVDGDGQVTQRVNRPGKDDPVGAAKFQARVDELVEDADEDTFNDLLERFTGGKASSPPKSDGR